MPLLIPELGPFVAGLLRGLLSFAATAKIKQQISYLYNWLNIETTALFQLVNAVFVIFQSEQKAWTTSKPRAKAGMDSLLAATNDTVDTVNYLVDTLLPATFTWLIGYIEQDVSKPLGKQAGYIEKDVATVTAKVNVLETWKQSDVDPTVKSYRIFIQNWNKVNAKAVQTLVNWIGRPSEFGTWAAPVVIGPLTSLLGSAHGKGKRDSLEVVLLKAWLAEPAAVWDTVQQWLVTG